MISEYYIFLVVLLGIAVRTLIPYLQKLQAGEISKFDMKYVASLLLTLIWAVPVAVGVFSTIELPDTITSLGFWFTVFLAGMGANTITNWPIDSATRAKAALTT